MNGVSHSETPNVILDDVKLLSGLCHVPYDAHIQKEDIMMLYKRNLRCDLNQIDYERFLGIRWNLQSLL